MSDILRPDWPVPANIHAFTTTRLGPGVSELPFHRFNLGARCGDSPSAVRANREALNREYGLPAEPLWLHQVHGIEVVSDDGTRGSDPLADAAVTSHADSVLAVLTADCLPVLFCNTAGSEVAAAHAGWRGLCGGILRKTVATFKYPPDLLLAYLGPAIGPQVFEVGGEVLQAFLDQAQNPTHRQAIAAAFRLRESVGDKYLADLYALARAELQASGVTEIYGGDYCSYSDSERFYSYRREPKTGRNGSLIWLRG